jgi:hypothetical protein
MTMNISEKLRYEKLKPEKAEELFLTALVIVVLLILPMWGAVAMMVGSAIGLAVHVVLFRERLRSQGRLKAAMIVFTLGAVFALAFVLALN